MWQMDDVICSESKVNTTMTIEMIRKRWWLLIRTFCGTIDRGGQRPYRTEQQTKGQERKWRTQTKHRNAPGINIQCWRECWWMRKPMFCSVTHLQIYFRFQSVREQTKHMVHETSVQIWFRLWDFMVFCSFHSFFFKSYRLFFHEIINCHGIVFFYVINEMVISCWNDSE